MSWIAIELYKHGMVKLGDFKLSSGLFSPFYIDMRKLYSYPDLTKRIVQELVSKMPLSDVDVLAGVESAGIPLAAYMSCLTDKPMAYVRKEKKNHGVGLAVEGLVAGRRVAVVDDVVTTGNSIVKAVQHLVEAGAIPLKAIVIVDREQGAKKLLRQYGVELYALITARWLFRELHSEGLITREEYARIVEYLEKFGEE